MKLSLEVGPGDVHWNAHTRALFARKGIGGLLLAAVAGVALHSASARADVVSSPPDSCMDGTQGETSHAGPHCAPSSCEAAADCPPRDVYSSMGSNTYADRTTCREMKLCVRQVGCGGFVELLPDGGIANPCFQPWVVGRCFESDSECPENSVCTTLDACSAYASEAEYVAATNGAGSLDDDSGGCSLSPTSSKPMGATAFGFLLVALGAAFRRRR